MRDAEGENGRELVKTGVCEEVGNVVPSEAEGAQGEEEERGQTMEQ